MEIEKETISKAVVSDLSPPMFDNKQSNTTTLGNQPEIKLQTLALLPEQKMNFHTPQPKDASIGLQEYKEEGPIEFKLHKAIEKITKISESEGGFFVSERDFCYFYNLLHELDVRAKDSRGNTAFLLLTEALVKQPPPYIVDQKINYAVCLFKLFLLREMEISIYKLLQTFGHAKVIDHIDKLHIDKLHAKIKFKHWTLGSLDFLSNDKPFFATSTKNQPSKMIDDLMPSMMIGDLMPMKEILEDILKTSSEINLSDKEKNAEKYCDLPGEFFLEDEKLEEILHSNKGYDSQKAELIFRLIDSLLLRCITIHPMARQLTQSLPFLFQREFDKKVNHLLPSSLLILSNKKDESPLFWLLFNKNIIKTSNQKLFNLLISSDGYDKLVHQYTEKLVGTHFSSKLLMSKGSMLDFLNDYRSCIPSLLLEELFTNPIILESSEVSSVLLEQALEKSLKENDLKMMRLVFSNFEKEIYQRYQDSKYQNSNIDVHMRHKARLLDFFQQAYSYDFLLANKYFDILELMLEKFYNSGIKIDSKFVVNFFLQAIKDKNHEFVCFLLSVVKNDEQVFKDVKTIRNGYGFSLLDIALCYRNTDIINSLTTQGFEKGLGDKKALRNPNLEESHPLHPPAPDETKRLTTGDERDSIFNAKAFFFEAITSGKKTSEDTLAGTETSDKKIKVG